MRRFSPGTVPRLPSAIGVGAAFLVLILSSGSCARLGSRKADVETAPSLVVDQPTIPDQPEPFGLGFAAVVPDQTELDRQWSRFRMGGEPPEVNFQEKVLVLAGFGESGSCPFEFLRVDIDRGQKNLTVIGERQRGVCTQDYNPRTIGVTVDRDDLPDGVFHVHTPDGAPISVATRPVEVPPQEPPVMKGATISAVSVTFQPEPVGVDGSLRVGVRNDSDHGVATGPIVYLDRWMGLGFEPASPSSIGDAVGAMVAKPGTEERLLTIDLRDYDLMPGWYRFTVDLGVQSGDYGRLVIRRSIELVGD